MVYGGASEVDVEVNVDVEVDVVVVVYSGGGWSELVVEVVCWGGGEVYGVVV